VISYLPGLVQTPSGGVKLVLCI